jgi:hypothetical protein
MRGAWLGLTLAGCALDVGTTPNTPACARSPDYYVSDVWPRYLDANRCASSGCHSFANGHGYLRLRPPEPAPTPGTALTDWPLAWRENYLSTIQLLRCDSPLDSRLLSVPMGVNGLHPPGPVVIDRATAKKVVETWVATP